MGRGLSSEHGDLSEAKWQAGLMSFADLGYTADADLRAHVLVPAAAHDEVRGRQ